MVQDFLRIVQQIHGSSSRIAPLGFNAESWTDRLSDDLRAKLLQMDRPIVSAIASLEQGLASMKSRTDYARFVKLEQLLSFLKISKCFHFKWNLSKVLSKSLYISKYLNQNFL